MGGPDLVDEVDEDGVDRLLVHLTEALVHVPIAGKGGDTVLPVFLGDSFEELKQFQRIHDFFQYADRPGPQSHETVSIVTKRRWL